MKEIFNTFSDILQNEKENNPRLTRTIVEGFYEDGLRISNRSIQLYIKGQQVPSFPIAREILKILKVRMSEQELLSILAYSLDNKSIDMEKVSNPDILIENNPTLKKRISIKYSDFTFLNDSKINKKNSIDLIENKVLEKYGNDKYAFNRYIRDLIDKDMNEN